ncbi:MAG: hypothetical protein Q9166_007338 [cf. Caloplaca sp. 2 TL-2023]
MAMRIRRAIPSDFPTAASFSVAAFANDELYHFTNPYAAQNPSSFRDCFLRRLKVRNISPGYIIWVAVIADLDALEDDTLGGEPTHVEMVRTSTITDEKVVGYAIWVRHGQSAQAKKWQTQSWSEWLESRLLQAQDSYVDFFQLDRSASPSQMRSLASVGFWTDEFPGFTERWHLQNLVVDPDYQRCGVGTRLISWGLEQAEEEKVPVTLSTSTVAEPLYRKMGFKTYKLTDLPGNTTTVEDTCCFNAPGGQLLLTQFWDTNPPTGPNNSWTVHGLWPDRCDGTYDQYCDPSREYTNVSSIISAAGKTDLLNYMNTYWKDYQGDDESFWEHEWDKHGTCISTLEPGCYDNYTPQEEVVAYFQKTVDLFKTLNSYDFLSAAGIAPSSIKTYTSAEIAAALAKPRGVQVAIQCRNGELDEIWYFFNVRGSVQTGDFVPTEPDGAKSNCPATGVKYLPKTGTPPSTTLTTATGTPPTSTPTPGIPFSGKGTLPVSSGGKTNGCIISGGTWYTTGTCASFTAAASASVTAPTVFTTHDGKLLYNGNSSFYTSSVPTGSTQASVSVAQQATTLTIGWKSA